MTSKTMTSMRLQKKGNFDLPDMSYTNTSVLVRAIFSEDIHLVRFLLKRGSDPNKSVGVKKIRPIMVACHAKNKTTRLAIFRSLFKYRVNPELVDIYGQNGLMYTCAMRLREELEIILDHFVCSLYKSDIQGNTLIHVCAQYGNIDVMRPVLKKMHQYSMSVNVRNHQDHTPLDKAILQRNMPCVSLLTEFGCHSALRVRKNAMTQQDPIIITPRNHKPAPLQKNVSLSKRKTEKKPVNWPLDSKTKTKPTFKDSEKILHQLLEYKSQRGIVVPSNDRVPLDQKWISTTRTHLRAIADSQEWVRSNSYLLSGPAKTLSIHSVRRMQAKSSVKKWKKVIIAATCCSKFTSKQRR